MRRQIAVPEHPILSPTAVSAVVTTTQRSVTRRRSLSEREMTDTINLRSPHVAIVVEPGKQGRQLISVDYRWSLHTRNLHAICMSRSSAAPRPGIAHHYDVALTDGVALLKPVASVVAVAAPERPGKKIAVASAAALIVIRQMWLPILWRSNVVVPSDGEMRRSGKLSDSIFLYKCPTHHSPVIRNPLGSATCVQQDER